MIEQTARSLNHSTAILADVPASETLPFTLSAANQNDLTPDATRLAAQALAREKARTERTRRRLQERRRWLALLVFMLALLLVLKLFPQQVVRTLPGMAQVYQALGMPVAAPALKLRNLRLRWMRGVDGKPELLVSARLVNDTGRALPMPRISLWLLDGSGKRLYQWNIPTRRTRMLANGAQARLRTRLAAVPAQATSIQVRLLPTLPR